MWTLQLGISELCFALGECKSVFNAVAVLYYISCWDIVGMLLGFCWDDHSWSQNRWDGSQLSPSQTPTIQIFLTQYYFCTKMKCFESHDI